MKTKLLMVWAGFLVFTAGLLPSQSLFPLPDTTSAVAVKDTVLPKDSTVTKKSPCPGADCAGDSCTFKINVKSKKGANCAANEASVELEQSATGTKCKGDFDRSNRGNITYILCSGEKCVLDDSYFPPGGLWPPYHPGNPAPPGRKQLSAGCWAAISIELVPWPGTPPFDKTKFKFKGIKTIIPDFSIQTFCICGTDTTKDSITIKIDSNSVFLVTDTVEEHVVPFKAIAGQDIISNGSFAVSNIYPNPATDYLKLVLRSRSTQAVTMQIHNAQMQLVWQSIEILNEGENELELDVKGLRGGIYFVTLTAPDGQAIVMKFIHL